MASKVKAGVYVTVSSVAIRIIATQEKKNPHLLLAYLILARFTSAYTSDAIAPNTMTGAGAQAVSSRLQMRWSRAGVLIKKLVELEVIRAAPAGAKAGKSAATYQMCFAGDIRMPVALVDGLDDTCTVGGISRLMSIETVQTSNVGFAAMVLLLLCYQRHDMLVWGGVDFDSMWMDWRIDSVTPEGRGFSVRATRAPDDRIAASRDFVATFRETLGLSDAQVHGPGDLFRDALRALKDEGLLYECVTLLNAGDQVLRKRLAVAS